MKPDVFKDRRYILGHMSEAEICGIAAEFQSRADNIFSLHGQKAPPIYAGEDLADYRRRLLKNVQPCLPDDSPWRQVDARTISKINLPIFEHQMIDTAVADFQKPEGPLRMAITRDDSGRELRKFYGDPENTWKPFKQKSRIVTDWRTPRGKNAPGAVVPVSTVMSDGSVRPAR